MREGRLREDGKGSILTVEESAWIIRLAFPALCGEMFEVSFVPILRWRVCCEFLGFFFVCVCFAYCSASGDCLFLGCELVCVLFSFG